MSFNKRIDGRHLNLQKVYILSDFNNFLTEKKKFKV